MALPKAQQQTFCFCETSISFILKIIYLLLSLKDVEGDEALQDLAQHVMKVYVIHKEGDNHQDVGIVIEGQEVIDCLSNVTQACAILMGLIYALNLSYPKELKFTIEAFQKI